jgi:7-cyano-7-deazaguanine synthase
MSQEGRALVLLSGGTDSTTCLMFALQDCVAVDTVSIVYGQKHHKEIIAAGKIAGHFGLRHDVVELPSSIFAGAESTLVGRQNPNPKMTYKELMESEGPSPTVVPNRNWLLIGIAGALAASRGNTDYVYFGPHATDAHHNAYPDCTPEFTGAAAAALQIASYGKTRLRTPIQWMIKEQVVQTALNMGAPLDLTWSCYVGEDIQCGTCPTCIERIEAFKSADIIDPVPYAVDVDWGDALPYGISMARRV